MAVRAQTDARREAVKRHDATKVDRATIRLPKGSKDAITSHGYSVNAYVIQAVQEKMERDGIKILEKTQ